MVFRERIRDRRIAFELSSIAKGVEFRINTGVGD
jgi:hypothetical protein